MNRQVTFALVVSAVCWPIIAAAFAYCVHELPPIYGGEWKGTFNHSKNWFGMDDPALNIVWLSSLIGIFVGKYFIREVQSPNLRIYYFAMLIVGSLPYIWLFVVTDWRNLHVYPVACWVHYPIGIWAVPMFFFIADTANEWKLTPLWFILRSILEIALMFVWGYAWAFISFFC